MYTAASPYGGQVSSLPALGGEAGSYYTSPSVQTYASPGGVYGAGTLAGGAYTGGTLAGGAYSGGTLAGGAYTGGTLAGGAYSGGTLAGGAYTGGTLAGGAYTGGTSTLAGAYSGGVSGSTYSPSSGYTGGITAGSYTATPVTGATYTPGTISSAYTGGTVAGGLTTVSGGNYSSAPAYSAGTGSFSIAPANTYGGYYGAGTYSAPEASSASFTVPPLGQDLYGATSGLPTTPSMLLNPQPLQSAPSMIAYNGMGGFGTTGYSSAMDGPFKFYATPPGKLADPEPRPSKTDDGAQTGGSLRAGVTSEPREDVEISSKKSGKKYNSKKKKSSGCC